MCDLSVSDESMAEEQTALSPSAAPPPTGADYDAIYAAVMETVRGRWFLGEYAKRNRNADTELLLAALERIETGWRDRRPAPPGEQLRIDLVAMAKAIARTRTEIAAIKPDGEAGTLSEATEELGSIVQMTERATSDILAAAEQVQEIAWTLRERGTDSTACDALDRHANDIYTACSFQDLTGQRTRKVVEVMGFLEGRIRAMIDIWGDAETSEADAAVTAAPHIHDDPETEHLDQPDIDRMMPAVSGPDHDAATSHTLEDDDIGVHAAATVDHGGRDAVVWDTEPATERAEAVPMAGPAPIVAAAEATSGTMLELESLPIAFAPEPKIEPEPVAAPSPAAMADVADMASVEPMVVDFPAPTAPAASVAPAAEPSPREDVPTPTPPTLAFAATPPQHDGNARVLVIALPGIEPAPNAARASAPPAKPVLVRPTPADNVSLPNRLTVADAIDEMMMSVPVLLDVTTSAIPFGSVPIAAPQPVARITPDTIPGPAPQPGAPVAAPAARAEPAFMLDVPELTVVPFPTPPVAAAPPETTPRRETLAPETLPEPEPILPPTVPAADAVAPLSLDPPTITPPATPVAEAPPAVPPATVHAAALVEEAPEPTPVPVVELAEPPLAAPAVSAAAPAVEPPAPAMPAAAAAAPEPTEEATSLTPAEPPAEPIEPVQEPIEPPAAPVAAVEVAAPEPEPERAAETKPAAATLIAAVPSVPAVVDVPPAAPAVPPAVAAPTPTPIAAVLSVPQKPTAPRRIDALAAVAAMSDDDKIALFS